MSTPNRESSRYDEWHKQRVANGRNKRMKKKTSIRIRTKTITCKHIGETLLSKEYLTNRFNLLRLVVLIVAMLLLFTCILYGVGSILILSLNDFWCNSYTWDEISNYNRLNNNAMGVGACFVSSRLYYI